MITNRRDVIWGYTAQFLNFGGALLLLPLLLRYLSPEEMGLWYLFLAIGGAAQLLELGFQPTIARHTAYVYAGAKSIQAHGVPEINENIPFDIFSLSIIFSSSKKIYFLLSIILAVALVVFGGGYLVNISSGVLNEFELMCAWGLYLSSAVIYFCAGNYSAILQGRGDLTAVNKTLALSKVFMMLGCVPLLMAGFDLLGVAISSVIAAVVYFTSLRYLFFSAYSREDRKCLMDNKSCQVRELWDSSWRLGGVQVGSFLISKANILVASAFFNLKEVATYGVTLQVVTLLVSISYLLINLYLPKISYFQISGNKDGAKKIFCLSLFSACIVYFFGAAFIFMVAPIVLTWVGSQTEIVPRVMLLLILAIFFFEMVHSICAAYLTTLNYIPFFWPSILSGIAIVLSSYFLSKYSDLGLLALVISQGVVQLLYNNWRWPVDALGDIGMNLREVFVLGGKELRLLIAGK